MKRAVLITAGATRNPLDSMRVITANSSGSTGVYLANALLAHDLDITVMGSPRALAILPETISGMEFGSTRDLESKMHEWVCHHPDGIIVHCAAVGDFEYRAQDNHKIPSGQTITITLHPTPKILDQIKSWSETCILVSFKAAAPNTDDDTLLSIADAQRMRTQSDIVFANVLERIHTDVLLLNTDKHQWYRERLDGLNALVTALKDLSILEQ